MVSMGCVWTTYGLCMCCEGGVGCMWWPWWPWGTCGLPMGYIYQHVVVVFMIIDLYI